jgi:hypothetical protein
MTPRAITLTIRNLEKLRSQGHSPAAVLDQSVMNGWKGVFPLRSSTPANASAPTSNVRELVESARAKLAREGFSQDCVSDVGRIRDVLGFKGQFWAGGSDGKGDLVILSSREDKRRLDNIDLIAAAKTAGLRCASIQVRTYEAR